MQLGNYPVVIDPVQPNIEMTKDGQRVTLERLAIDRVQALCAELANGRHFFSYPSEGRPLFLIAYTQTGVLSAIWYRNKDGVMGRYGLPAEGTGELVTLPSLRLTFSDVQARNAVMHYIRKVLDGTAFNPAICESLTCLKTISPIPVAVLQGNVAAAEPIEIDTPD